MSFILKIMILKLYFIFFVYGFWLVSHKTAIYKIHNNNSIFIDYLYLPLQSEISGQQHKSTT